MPKMKTKSAVKKRFRISKSGKAMCSRPARGHMHASKDGRRRRRLRTALVLPPQWSRAIRKMMGS